MDYMDVVIKQYFDMGLQQKEILSFLQGKHNIFMSLRTLRRHLHRLRLTRRKFTSFEQVFSFIMSQINTPAQLHGYRWMHLKCIQNGIVCSQSIVRRILLEVDPNGVEYRRRRRLRRRQYISRGPNYLWHVDSYDKLKRYGICINGCIDGFSRHIVWLRASTTSSDPKVIASYYLNAVNNLKGCPVTLRSDCGTENVMLETLQGVFRHCFGNSSSRPSHISGRSTANQRIESWWSILRKENAQYWINLFESIRDEGLFTGSYLDKALIQFCFMEIIQSQLNEVSFQWNIHRIRRSRNAIAPTGRPIVMFELPENYGCSDFLVNVPEYAVSSLKRDTEVTREPILCDRDVTNLCIFIMRENDWRKDNNIDNTISLYTNLRNKVTNLLRQI